MAIVERTAKLFEAGEYPDKDITVDNDMLDAIVANSGEIPVRIEHLPTPFDGFLGSVKNLFRRGKELFGRIRLPSEVWSLIDKSGAKRLSVGMSCGETPHLYEVSIVNSPRVASARIFSKGGIGYTGEILMSLGGMATDDVTIRVEEALNPEGAGYEEPYRWIVALYEDSVVVDAEGVCYRYPLDVSSEGVVTLGEPVEVVRTWTPIAADSGGASGDNNGGTNMSTDNEQNPEADVRTYTEAEVEAIAKKAAEDAVAAVRGELTEEIAKERTMSDTISGLLASGRITAEQVEPVRKVLEFGADVETLEALLPAAGNPAAPVTFATDEKVSKFLAGLGVTDEDIQKVRA